jgi:hypothetical protein
VFFVEGQSERDFLEGFLPKVIQPHVTAHFQVFKGKQDLEKQLVRRMKYWLLPNTEFVVLRDQDSGDCVAIKDKLRELCLEAGRPNAVVRIACRELETFFVGDWSAIATAFDRPGVAGFGKKAKYRNPDLLGSPSAEIKRHIPGFQKREGARRIAPHLDPTKNQSHSFKVLVQALQRIAAP